MPNSDELQSQEVHVPPSADPHLASKYVDWLAELIDKDKIAVNHSDLKKFQVSALEDHYRVDLKEYDVEVSHSKHPKSGEDIYTMIFNNLTRLSEDNHLSRVILAYVHLTREQFERFKSSADDQIHRKIRAAEEKRFREAMEPIDDLLDKIASGDEEKTKVSEEPENIKESEIAAQDSNEETNETFIDQAAESMAPLPEPMKLPPLPQEGASFQSSSPSFDTISAPQPMDLPPVPSETSADSDSTGASTNPYLNA